jgi:flagellar biosynthesis/type III secretory pathway M-ring protein FliF/YscJ
MTNAPDTLIGLAAVVIIQLVVLAVALINARQARGARDTAAAATEQVRAQLQNGSEGIYRDVFDGFVTDVHARFDRLERHQAELHQDVTDLRGELREERGARTDLEEWVRRAIKRRWPF